ncbi:MAG: LuxR C-terminal-related transcriptional regulator [Bryobacterales bacterium]
MNSFDVPYLNTQESQILSLVRRGDRDSEIAATLSLSLPAVQSLLHQVSAKLDARDRLELAMMAASMDSRKFPTA